MIKPGGQNVGQGLVQIHFNYGISQPNLPLEGGGVFKMKQNFPPL